jgi:four helix bundle protein
MINDFTKKFRFREFQIYKDARRFRNEIHRITGSKFPGEEKYGLTSQTWRACDSIILNIAEGADRSTDKDFALFLNRSHTSLNEVVACLDVATDSQYILENERDNLLHGAALLSDQITAFRRKLLKDANQK